MEGTMTDDIILNDYLNHDSIFNTDSVRVKRLKYIIEFYLTDNERQFFILYLESNGKVKKLCKQLNADLSVTRNYINRIKRKIRYLYNELFNND